MSVDKYSKLYSWPIFESWWDMFIGSFKRIFISKRLAATIEVDKRVSSFFFLFDMAQRDHKSYWLAYCGLSKTIQ